MIAIIVGILLIVLIGYWWYRKSLRSGYKLYYRTAFNKLVLEKGSVEDAIYEGLDKLSYRKPFSALSIPDKQFVASNFARFNDITVIEGLIIECEKKQSPMPLIDKQELLKFAKFVASRQKSQTETK